MKFAVYLAKRGEYRWRRKHANGNIVATASEGCKAKADALKGIENVKKSKDAPVASV